MGREIEKVEPDRVIERALSRAVIGSLESAASSSFLLEKRDDRCRLRGTRGIFWRNKAPDSALYVHVSRSCVKLAIAREQ